MIPNYNIAIYCAFVAILIFEQSSTYTLDKPYINPKQDAWNVLDAIRPAINIIGKLHLNQSEFNSNSGSFTIQLDNIDDCDVDIKHCTNTVKGLNQCACTKSTGTVTLFWKRKFDLSDHGKSVTTKYESKTSGQLILPLMYHVKLSDVSNKEYPLYERASLRFTSAKSNKEYTVKLELPNNSVGPYSFNIGGIVNLSKINTKMNEVTYLTTSYLNYTKAHFKLSDNNGNVLDEFDFYIYVKPMAPIFSAQPSNGIVVKGDNLTLTCTSVNGGTIDIEYFFFYDLGKLLKRGPSNTRKSTPSTAATYIFYCKVAIETVQSARSNELKISIINESTTIANMPSEEPITNKPSEEPVEEEESDSQGLLIGLVTLTVFAVFLVVILFLAVKSKKKSKKKRHPAKDKRNASKSSFGSAGTSDTTDTGKSSNGGKGTILDVMKKAMGNKLNNEEDGVDDEIEDTGRSSDSKSSEQKKPDYQDSSSVSSQKRSSDGSSLGSSKRL